MKLSEPDRNELLHNILQALDEEKYITLNESQRKWVRKFRSDLIEHVEREEDPDKRRQARDAGRIENFPQGIKSRGKI